MALSCNGSGEITLQEIVNAINQNETALGNVKLDDLVDVTAPSPSDKDVITFDIVSGTWVVGQLPNTQIPSDWNQSDGAQPDYIRNKPDLSQYEEDLGNPSSDGQILSSDELGNRTWVDNISSVNLDYVPMANDGTIANDSGDDATIPQATDVYAGLMSASDKSILDTLWVTIDGGIYN